MVKSTTKKESSAQALMRIAKRERSITVNIGGDVIELQKPDAVTYQMLIDKAQSIQAESDNDVIDASQAIELYAEILSASVPDLEVEDAKEVIIGIGINSALTRACLAVLGTSDIRLDDTMGKS